MATWTKFYVNTADVQGLTARLKSLSGIATATYSSFPKDHYASFLMGDPLPSYLVFTATQPRWVTVVYNSAHKLPDWCKQLSSEFKTKVIITMAQSVSMYYYFALYENGELKRELEYCYSEDLEPVNFGEPLACEQGATLKVVQTEEADDDSFDFDDIEKYCEHFGLTIQRNYHEYEWTVIKGKSTAKTTGQYLKSLQKPCWKFWS